MMFGDNKSVVNSAAIPHSKMHKRWVALSHHRVRYAVAAGIINVYHIAGNKNPSDILSKHWGLSAVWDTMKPLLFWNWKSMHQGPEDSDEGNKTKEDVAEKVSKVDAKGIVKVTAQAKGTNKASQSYRGE